ncbi:GDSL-type esterase/lipase family protein [Lentibacillus salicampi]|uniref:DUF5011 domain-containing protein n=1 Tax=Lentibacillus salicampi TaxID=175306 RepID=A0A4Y9AEL2_9BACI|nr:GDSL-type esterase/lipase family protein [Lentibacillus salicampi]TFJ94266.1 DUF5011 domain-containing protein [Lentibacillus salicampi]
MKLVKNSFLLSLLMIFLLFPVHTLADSEQYDQDFDYVALGDSLAAGYLNEPDEDGNRRIGNGYPVYIQDGIENQYGYDVNLINAGVGGFTTEDVYIQLSNNTNGIMGAIADADLITIGAGANDVLQKVDIENVGPEAIEEATSAINQINSNMEKIFDEIANINPDAPIFVLGYYNALPYLEEKQSLIVPMIDAMNQTLKEVAQSNDAIFIPTFEAFEGKHETYLPNPNDIHPNEAGYEVIADKFLEEIVPAIDAVKPIISINGDESMKLAAGVKYEELGASAEDNIDGDLSKQIKVSGEVNTNEPGEYPVTYTVTDTAGNTATVTRLVTVVKPEQITVTPSEKTEVSPGVTVMIKGTETTLTVPSDIPWGTTLEVYDASDSEKVTGAEGLALAGDVYNFKLTFPSEGKGTSGSYALQMGYDADKFDADQVAIYHFQPDSGEWKKQNGTVDEKSETITLKSSRLLTYGVFVKASEDNNQNDSVENTGQKDDESGQNRDCKCDEEDTAVTYNDRGETKESTYDPLVKGGELPETVTNNPLMILIGSLTALIGGILIAFRGKHAS